VCGALLIREWEIKNRRRLLVADSYISSSARGAATILFPAEHRKRSQSVKKGNAISSRQHPKLKETRIKTKKSHGV